MGPQALTMLAAGLLLTVSDPGGDAAREEMARLQGTWQFASWEAQSVAKPAEEVKQYTAVLKGDQWTVSKGDKIAARIIFRVDPTRTLKTLDLIDINGARTMRGIYALQGDTFKFCDRDVEKGRRPTEFATRPDSGLVLVVWHRIKPGGPWEDVAGAERAKLQGNWRFVSLEEGERRPDTELKKYSVVFKDDRWTVSEGDRVAAETFFRPDPTKTPKAIDIVDIDKGRIIRGIYSLEADTLTICDRGAEKGGRPTEFATKAEFGIRPHRAQPRQALSRDRSGAAIAAGQEPTVGDGHQFKSALSRYGGRNRSAVGKTAISTSGRSQPLAPPALTSLVACTSALRRAILRHGDAMGGLGPLCHFAVIRRPSQTAPLTHRSSPQ